VTSTHAMAVGVHVGRSSRVVVRMSSSEHAAGGVCMHVSGCVCCGRRCVRMSVVHTSLPACALW
jgi:hypothetical protein